MEPLRIELQNFTNYGHAELDLSPIALAALTGQNGAGKSSLLDAITVCLFGEGTKGGAKALDNYVRTGESEMRLGLDFGLRDQVYRVIRHKSLAKSKHILELFQVNPDGTTEPMSGKGIDDTQAKINSLLRMDFKTLTASSLILQGKADSLTADMTDSQRKEVLARILGLDVWEQVQERAKDHAKQAKGQAKLLTDQAANSEAKVGRRPEVEAAVQTKEQALTGAEESVRQATDRVTNLEAKLQQKPLLEALIQDIDRQRFARFQDREQATKDMNGARLEITQQEALLGRPATIAAQIPEAETALTDAETRLKIATAEANEADTKVLMAATVQTQVNDLDRQIQSRRAEQAQITADGQRIRQQLDGYQAVAMREQAIRSAAETATALEADLAELSTQEQRYNTMDRQARELERQGASFDREHQAWIAALKVQIDICQQQTTLLAQVPCAGDMQAQCPLLGGARKAAEQLQVLTQDLEARQQMANPYAADLQRVTTERDGIGYDAETLAGIKSALAEVQADARQMPALQTALLQVAELTERRAKLEADFHAKATEIQETTKRRQELAARVGDLAAMENAHRMAQGALMAAQRQEATTRERLAGLRKELEEALTQSEQATERISALRARVVELNGRIAQIDWQTAELQQRHAEAEAGLASLSGLVAALETDRTALAQARRQEADLREQIGRLRHELAEIERSEVEVREIRTRIDAHERQAMVYDVLTQASGQRGGVPALLIEAAVPQIEQLTNDMLSRMAGGRLAVRLDTQADTKSGTTQEVLRIIVLDGGKERPYVTFSGAERFMVDLSLRVAISKFLAHRAGAEIKLLVLDEGIAAADPVNRDGIMAALFEASREFSKTLIVSHIPELQDALPQRIEVSRGPDGSTIRVVA